jgi:hypothetical protein
VATDPFRPTDPYGFNWTRRYRYNGNELTIETTNNAVAGPPTTMRAELNAQGYIVRIIDSPTPLWEYNADNQLLRYSTAEQTFENGNRVRRLNMEHETVYRHDLTKPNPIIDPTQLWWGKPDKNQLVSQVDKVPKTPNSFIDSTDITYTYNLNAQGLATRRITYSNTKPSANYVMAQGVSSDQALEVTDYTYQ